MNTTLRKPLDQSMYKMKIIKDLGMHQKPGSATRKRYAIFACTECGAEVEYDTQNAKKALYCKPCGIAAQKAKITTTLNQEDYVMKIVEDLGMQHTDPENPGNRPYRFALFECTTCLTHFRARAITAASKVQLSCQACVTNEEQTYKHPLYTIWNGIKQRCYSPKRKDYGRYGAIGVTMSEEWKDNYNSFYTWCLANGWQEHLHVDKDIKCRELGISPAIYSPETITFVTPSQNIREAMGQSVEQYTLSGEYIATFASPVEAAESIGLTKGDLISAVCRGENKTSNGFIWKYKT